MGRTYRRSSDESDYYREQKLRREMEKRAARHKRDRFDEDEEVVAEDRKPKKRY